MAAKPGILYVRAKITSDKLSPEVFNRWYEDIHIRDLLAMSGMDSGFRYEKLSPHTVDMPYLAMYPVKDIKWLNLDEFHSVPLHSDLLPGESKYINDLAVFSFRHYEALDKRSASGHQGPTKFIVTVAFDSTATSPAELYELSAASGSKPLRSSLFKLDNVPVMGPEAEKVDVPGYFVIHAYNELPDGLSVTVPDAKIETFRTLSSFGDVSAAL